MKIPEHKSDLPVAAARSAARRGAIILEAIAALMLLAAGLIFTVHVLSTCAVHRLASERILAAQLEAANCADRLSLVPYARLEESNFRDWKPSSQLRELIPAANLKISIADSKAADSKVDEPRNKRLTVQIDWPAVEGDSSSLQLSTWRFGEPAEAPPSDAPPVEAQP